jgi:5'(3')-deoxyribonucleotidase
MKKIWIDIDDVMNDFISFIIDELNFYTWKKIKNTDIDFWHLNQIWWVSFDELKDIYKKSDIYSKVPLLQENIDIIKRLENKNYQIIFITSRFLYHDYDTKNVTKMLFRKFWLDNDIYIWMNKSSVCKELWINIFIDDALYNCLDVKNNNDNIDVFLLDKLWNWEKELKRLEKEWFNTKNIDKINRIYSFNDLLLWII